MASQVPIIYDLMAKYGKLTLNHLSSLFLFGTAYLQRLNTRQIMLCSRLQTSEIFLQSKSKYEPEGY